MRAERQELGRVLDAARLNPRSSGDFPRLDWLALWAEELSIALSRQNKSLERAHEILSHQNYLLDRRLTAIDEKLDRLLQGPAEPSE